MLFFSYNTDHVSEMLGGKVYMHVAITDKSYSITTYYYSLQQYVN